MTLNSASDVGSPMIQIMRGTGDLACFLRWHGLFPRPSPQTLIYMPGIGAVRQGRAAGALWKIRLEPAARGLPPKFCEQARLLVETNDRCCHSDGIATGDWREHRGIRDRVARKGNREHARTPLRIIPGKFYLPVA
jgi:hypothetical protein